MVRKHGPRTPEGPQDRLQFARASIPFECASIPRFVMCNIRAAGSCGVENCQQLVQAKTGTHTHTRARARTHTLEQVADFFATVGEKMEEEIDSRTDENPVWLSTSGLGVYW